MGLGNRKKVTYVQPYNGKLTVSIESKEKGCLTRITKDGRKIHYYEHDYLTGFITKIEKSVNEYNKKKITSLNVTFEDGGEEFILSLDWFSTAAIGFFTRMENIDFSQKVTVELSMYNDRQYLFLQYGVGRNAPKIKRKYTKENPNGKPDWETKKVNGEETIDRTKELEFFENILNTTVQKNLSTLSFFQEDETVITADSVPGGMDVPGKPLPHME